MPHHQTANSQTTTTTEQSTHTIELTAASLLIIHFFFNGCTNDKLYYTVTKSWTNYLPVWQSLQTNGVEAEDIDDTQLA